MSSRAAGVPQPAPLYWGVSGYEAVDPRELVVPAVRAWDLMRVVERNWACARYFQKREFPLGRSFGLWAQGMVLTELPARTAAEAADQVRVLTGTEAAWRQVLARCAHTTMEMRREAGAVELARVYRVTDTPAGAWWMVQECQARGWTVRVELAPFGLRLEVLTGRTVQRVSGYARPFEELMGVLWLLAHGERVLLGEDLL